MFFERGKRGQTEARRGSRSTQEINQSLRFNTPFRNKIRKDVREVNGTRVTVDVNCLPLLTAGPLSDSEPRTRRCLWIYKDVSRNQCNQAYFSYCLLELVARTPSQPGQARFCSPQLHLTTLTWKTKCFMQIICMGRRDIW